MTQDDKFNQLHSTKVVPRIYVASLADYNAGRLHGCWIDASQSAEEIHEAIQKLLAASREFVAEDWAIHDYEGFGGLRLSEFECIEGVGETAQGIVEHGPVFAELVAHFGGIGGLDEARRYMTDGYRGAFSSLAAYVEEFLDDCYGRQLKDLPDFIR